MKKIWNMQTTKIKVKFEQLAEFTTDKQRWKLRHGPYQRDWNGYIIPIYDNPKTSWLLLKYNIVDFDH